MEKRRVLFICVHNSARSQMAEGYLKHFAGDKFEVESAGVSPGVLNPMAVAAMKDDGIDISQNKTKSIQSLYKQHRHYSYVIAVCSEEVRKQCPVFPGNGQYFHWTVPDPSSIPTNDVDSLAKTKYIRDEIKDHIQAFIKSI